MHMQRNCFLFSQWPADKYNKFKKVREIKKRKGNKLKEEDANLKRETVQCSLKEYVSKEVHYHSPS